MFSEQEKFLADIERRKSEIKAKEQVLEEKLKAIDDRDNTHVRREIGDRMLTDIQQQISQFGVSQATAQKRKPVLIGILALFIAFTVLGVWTAAEIRFNAKVEREVIESRVKLRNPPRRDELDKLDDPAMGPDKILRMAPEPVDRLYQYWLSFRMALFSFGLIGTILYYIKWQNKWAECHANSEFQLQQFCIDVNRANWVIESCLEWRKETDSPMPPELLTSIANGLFANTDVAPETVVHPADALASALMGSASKLKLKLRDSEMDIDKPGKVAKAVKVGAAKKAG